jgi:hypothetical protein
METIDHHLQQQNHGAGAPADQHAGEQQPELRADASAPQAPQAHFPAQQPPPPAGIGLPGMMPFMGMPGPLPPAAQQGPAPSAPAPTPALMPSMMMNPALLAQVTGVSQETLAANPALALQMQMFLTQRMMMAQQLMQQAQAARTAAPVEYAAAAAPPEAKAPTKGKGRGGGTKHSKQSKQQQQHPAPLPHVPAGPREDPGGKVIWAKVQNYPWWPAKTMDPTRDRSFPPDADPPRPTSIPVRFFGTHDFGWMGSKRAIEDWEEGFNQHISECDQESFIAAVAEAEKYRKDGVLPDKFYVAPTPEGKAKGSKRGRKSASAKKPGPTEGEAATEGAEGGKGRSGRGGPSAEDRSALVQARKRQRLQEAGLVPPEDTPYGDGRVAANPELMRLGEHWEVQDPEIGATVVAAAAAPPQPFRALVPRETPVQEPAPVEGDGQQAALPVI